MRKVEKQFNPNGIMTISLLWVLKMAMMDYIIIPWKKLAITKCLNWCSGPTTTRGFVLKHVQWEQSELILKLDHEQAFDENSLKYLQRCKTQYLHICPVHLLGLHTFLCSRILCVFLKYKTTQSSFKMHNLYQISKARTKYKETKICTIIITTYTW